MFDKSYYVVYRRSQLIRGPIDKITARDFAEDLDMALMDPGYEAVTAREYRRIQSGPNILERLWDRLHHHHEDHGKALPKAA